MQVKKRINNFFGNILRKERVQHEHQEESASSAQVKVKQKINNKSSNQSYSQWNLMAHIDGESIEDDSSHLSNQNDNNVIYTDGLACNTENISVSDLNDSHKHRQMTMNEHVESKGIGKSFLKRSGSLLSRSFRRSKKKSKNKENEDGSELQGQGSQSVFAAVDESNTNTVELPKSGEGSTGEIYSNKKSKILTETNALIFTQKDRENNYAFLEHSVETDKWDDQGRKDGLKNGLRRQASKLVSRFQRSPASVRLKPSISVESFPVATRRNTYGSFSTDEVLRHGSPNRLHDTEQKNAVSIKRKLSFKKARKVVRKGVTSFGKSMIHASAVMPITYESPPTNFYPDHEDEYPPHLVQCYYRTISYQPKEGYMWNDDKAGHQHGLNTRPTAFYQHGYCYNG